MMLFIFSTLFTQFNTGSFNTLYSSISLNFLSTSFLTSESSFKVVKLPSAETLRLLWIKLIDRCLLDELATGGCDTVFLATGFFLCRLLEDDESPAAMSSSNSLMVSPQGSSWTQSTAIECLLLSWSFRTWAILSWDHFKSNDVWDCERGYVVYKTWVTFKNVEKLSKFKSSF